MCYLTLLLTVKFLEAPMHKNRLHFIRGISLLPLGLLFVKVASLVSLLKLRELASSSHNLSAIQSPHLNREA